MASLNHDSELMMQHVAAVAVPNSSRFVTVKNHDGSPMVFSLGTDKRLYLIINNRGGQRILMDFGYDLLRLDKDYKVYAFDVAQDIDSTLYIILATEDQSSGSDLIVLTPFKPEEYDMAEKSTDLRLLKMAQKGKPTKTIVKSIYMTNCSRAPGQLYPPVIFAFQPLHRVSKTEDVARLVADKSSNTWDIEYDLSLPVNAFKMLAIQPVNLPLRVDGPLPGFVAIYEIQGLLQLIFMATKMMNSTYTKVTLKCPPGAATLSTFINSDGYTDLLVGGAGLYHFTAKQILKKDEDYQQLSNSGVFSSINQLHVTQTTEGISAWAANSANGIGYLTAGLTFETHTEPVQVIPDSQGGQFSPFRPSSSDPEQFIVSDNNGKLTLLQYDRDQHLWDNVPFFTPALSTTVEFRSYTTQITLTGADKLPLGNTEVLLKSSGHLRITVNGVAVVTNPDKAVAVRTDSSGHITLIIPTSGIASYEFNVIGAPGGELEGRSWVVDPTEKVNRVLDSIHNASDLMNARLQSGEKLLAGTNLTQNQIEQAAKAIEAVQNARKDILNKKSSEKTIEFEGRVQYSVAAAPPTPATESMVGPEPESIVQKASSGDGFVDMVWDAWYWLESMASKVVSWSIQKLKEGAAFIVQIGEKVYRWVMDGLAQIGKALSWLFEKVLEIGEKVIEWLGFIFNWGDIKATKNSIVHLTNSAIDCGVGYIDTLQSKVDVFFDGIIIQLEEFAGKSRPASINNVTANGDSGDEKPKNAINSAGANWAQYQFVHGGGASASVMQGKEGKQGKATTLEHLWSDVIVPLGETLKGLVEDLADLICRLFFFSGDKSLSVDQAMEQITGDILIKLVDGIRKVAVGIVGVVKSLVEEFKDLINTEITIPVFSSLYKNFLSGNDLTVLDGIALILAIPITVIYKIIAGRAPPDMTGVSYGQIIDCSIKDQQHLLEFNHFSSVTSLVGNGIDGLLSTLSIATSAVPARSTSLSTKTVGSAVLDKPMKGAAKGGAGGSVDVSKGHWKDMLGVISRLASIPTDSSLPAYELRWVSWVISCLNTIVEMASKHINAAASVAVERVVAVIEGALAAINYALLVSVKTIEFQTASFPGKNDTYEALKLTSGTFDLLGALSDGIGIISVDPATKGWAAVCSVATKAISYSIEGGVVVAKISDGEFNEIIAKVL